MAEEPALRFPPRYAADRLHLCVSTKLGYLATSCSCFALPLRNGGILGYIRPISVLSMFLPCFLDTSPLDLNLRFAVFSQSYPLFYPFLFSRCASCVLAPRCHCTAREREMFELTSSADLHEHVFCLTFVFNFVTSLR